MFSNIASNSPSVHHSKLYYFVPTSFNFQPMCFFQVRTIQKKTQSLEGQFDNCTEQIFEVTVKLEVKEKNLSSAEGDVGSLSRRVLLLEEEVERSEERLAKAVTNLSRLSSVLGSVKIIH